jgi:hypothetical protein
MANTSGGDALSELIRVAEQLKQVRAARQHFLGLWAVEQALILPGLDRVAADINQVGRIHGSPSGTGPMGGGLGSSDEGM